MRIYVRIGAVGGRALVLSAFGGEKWEGKGGAYQKKAMQKAGGSHTRSDWIRSSPPVPDPLPKTDEWWSDGLPIADIAAALGILVRHSC